jgi:hypothetical protein
MGSEHEKDISLAEHCQRIARSGGLSHSDAKPAAARKNLERAWLADQTRASLATTDRALEAESTWSSLGWRMKPERSKAKRERITVG